MTDRSARPPRSTRIGMAILIGLVVAYHLYGIHCAVQWVLHPSPGLLLFDYLASPQQVVAAATTPHAAAALEVAGRPAVVQEINGTRLSELPPTAARSLLAGRLLDYGAGQKNTLTLEDARGGRHVIELVSRRATAAELIRVQWLALAMELAALLYLCVGIYVWVRRPADGSARGLLELSLAAAVNLSYPWNWAGGSLAYWSHLLSQASLPLYAVGAVQILRHFTGAVERLRRARRVVVVIAISLGVVLVLTQELAARGLTPPLLARVAIALAGALLLGVITAMGLAPLWQRDRPLAIQRRVRLLRNAVMVSYLVPTLLLLAMTIAGESYFFWVPLVTLPLLASFPLMMAWAIFRYHLFDLRIVLARGALVVLLSAVVTVAYLAVVLVAFRAVGFSASSPLLLALTSGTLVVLATVAQVKLQRAIHVAIFRNREVYARAMARASDELAHARDLDGIARTLEAALLRAMGLARAYLAIWSSDERSLLECRPLGEGRPDPLTGERPEEVPRWLPRARFRTLERALAAPDIVTMYDQASLASPERTGAGPDPDASPTELDFWARFGLEAVVPLDVGREDEGRRVLGLLLLGPKLDRRPLDSEDRDLLSTLANQLAVALDNSLAFTQIRTLKEGLERQVEQRTAELSRALAELQEMQAHLIESEKQAMLGHLVAGLVHELNSPLGALCSSTDTITRSLRHLQELAARAPGEDGERARRALEAVHAVVEVQSASSERITQLVGSLTGFMGLDSEGVRAFDVRKGIDAALTVLAPEHAGRVEIVRDYAAKLSPVVCRPERLNSVFLNVLRNALRALPTAGGRIEIRVSNPDGGVRISISDNGRGIDPEKLGRVFEFGFTTKDDGRVGLRMGLPLSKRTIEELGGKLVVSSTPGRGTEVRMDLPSPS